MSSAGDKEDAVPTAEPNEEEVAATAAEPDAPITAEPDALVPAEPNAVVPAEPDTVVPVEPAAAATAAEPDAPRAEPDAVVPVEPDADAVSDAPHEVADAVSDAPDAPDAPDALPMPLSSMNGNIREKVEAGLQAFNTITDACQMMHEAIIAVVESIPQMKRRFNPEIGRLSDFVEHCKMLVSISDANYEATSKTVLSALEGLASDQRLTRAEYILSAQSANIGVIGTQLSLVLRVGEVFNVPVFTVYVMHDVFDPEKFDSEQSTQVVVPKIIYNSKPIATCSRLDLMLELLLYATKSDTYDKVNVLIARSIDEMIVSKFGSDSPNEVIRQVCGDFFGLLLPNETAKSLIIKATIIAIIQNPDIKTSDGKHFFDVFPSGQYVKYFGEHAYIASLDPANQGLILIPRKKEVDVAVAAAADVDDPGDAPGIEDDAPPPPSYPMTRTDIIVAAFTAANDAMNRSNANIIAAGGAAVSYYIADFMKSLHDNEFERVIPESGLDEDAIANLKTGCNNIPMNDIDCFVFGEVSREFLMLFSLYMMILYANFYERPKQYGVATAVRTQGTSIQFNLSANSPDTIELFMYGNNNNDANTRLISKRLKKNPNVQLVTQEIKCFSQLSNPICEDGRVSCTSDEYYAQPIDLVKKEMDDFLGLYDSIYVGAPPGENKPDLTELLTSQYATNVDNMVSIKTTMLDLVCIFCDEGQSLFIRIFMARKNPKDFSRLRVFIEIYLLYLIRANDPTFILHKDVLIREIKALRVMMSQLNEKYYLAQGNIAAVHRATAEQLTPDRNAFLQLLRSIGRKIVLISDPLNDRVPVTFRKETGKTTINFFKGRQNKQIKYPFGLDRHISDLYETYTNDVQMEDSKYESWLRNVFKELLFTPKYEKSFIDKMRKIIDRANDQMYFEVGFSDMFDRSMPMLRLFNLLNNVNGNDDRMFKQGMQRTVLRMFNTALLGPLRASMAKHSGIEPIASSVLKLYYTDDETKTKNTLNTLSAFVKSILWKIELTDDVEQTINDPDSYDDAVREAIGRIILEWNNVAAKGGATRKPKRVRKLSVKTTRRRVNKCFSGKRRHATRRTRASKGMHKRTRRI